MLVAQMSNRLHARPSFESAVGVILEDAIALHGAEYGNVQLMAGDHLVIVAQRGFKRPFLEAFREVRADDGCVCGRALRTRRTVVVKDADLDEEFAPFRAIAREAGFRSISTTPLVTSNNSFVGAVSAHFVNVHAPTTIELETLRSYSVIAADYLLELLGEEPLAAKAIAMNRGVYAPVLCDQ